MPRQTMSKNSGKPTGSMTGHSIDNGNLQFVKLAGSGTYGEVYHAVDIRTNKKYAVKVLPRKSTTGNAMAAVPGADETKIDARLLSREVSLYARLPAHKNIISLERLLHTKEQLFIIMEYCSGGDLYENISKNPYFRMTGNDALIRRLFLQYIDAIEHCHKHGIYHRDIKPENVLITSDGLNLKIIDFGLSTDQPWCREIGCGSAYYMSPECQGGVYGDVREYAAAPNDVWALGIILINLATGRNPWNRAHISDPLFRRYLTDKTFLCKAINASPEFQYIIHRTLEIDPFKRCTLQELRQLVTSCPEFVLSPESLRLRQQQELQKQQEKQKQEQAKPQVQRPVELLSGRPQPVRIPAQQPRVAQLCTPATNQASAFSSQSSAASTFVESSPYNCIPTAAFQLDSLKAQLCEATPPASPYAAKNLHYGYTPTETVFQN